jgi:palmitoyltransferase
MNILFNYFMCVTTNPGTPETPAFEKLVDEFREWIPDREISSKGAEDDDSNEDSNEEEFEEDGEEDSKVPLRRRRQRRSKPNTRDWLRRGPYEWSRCKNTGVPKPPRSHYCHVRKSIVLNMDHYCPWMFNTVGYLNYRYFVSFLIWLWLGCVFVAFEAGDQVFRKVGIKGGANPQYHHQEQSIMFLFVLCLSVGIAVSILMFWHIYLVLTAQTTIEFYGNFTRRAKWRGETPWRNPYDEGSFKKNWQRVFGRDSRFLGLLPSRREPSGYPWGSSRKGRGSGGSLQMV